MDFGIGAQFVIFALACVLIAAIAIHTHKKEQERMAAMRRFARGELIPRHVREDHPTGR